MQTQLLTDHGSQCVPKVLEAIEIYSDVKQMMQKTHESNVNVALKKFNKLLSPGYDITL